jgi:hypothetical protein
MDAKSGYTRFLPVVIVAIATFAALGWCQSLESPERIAAPERRAESIVRHVAVAAPRAAIAWAIPHRPDATPEGDSEDDLLPRFQVGAAENFPAREISLVVRKGQVVYFRESRNIEGVWYEDTYGLMGTLLHVQIRNPMSATPEWITLGKDGAYGIRHGPSIGTAQIGVRVEFKRLGEFRLRAIVLTGAIPRYFDTDSTDAKPKDSPYADFDFDVIPIKVTVVEDLDPAALEPEQVPRDPDLGYRQPFDPLFPQ